MQWFRSHLRFGSRLALFALALQLALTFGHIHRDQLVPAAAASTLAASSGPSSTARPAGVPAHKPDSGDDDICAICALIQLANITVPSVAPLLPLPTSVGWSRIEAPAEFHCSASPRRSFRARAPPLA